MTVYVDQVTHYPNTSLKYKSWCHMACTGDLEELHQLAAKIGLKLSWFQPYSHPHYDLTPAKRELAIRLGAIPVDSKEFVRLCIIEPVVNRRRNTT